MERAEFGTGSVESSAMERIQEFVPSESIPKLEDIRIALEGFGVDLEAVLAEAKEFGLSLVQEGLDAVAEFTRMIGEFIESSGVFEMLGEFSPTLQEAAIEVGRWIQNGVESVTPEHVSRLLGVIVVAALDPRVIAGDLSFWQTATQASISAVRGAL